jgi:lycopene cyclase domain-containing protein
LDSRWIYLAILLLTTAVPFALSFTDRSGFYRRFGAAFSAIACVAVPLFVWDAVFTARGVWGYNPNFYFGVDVLGLPLERILFHLGVPFAWLFLYDALERSSGLILPERGSRRALAVTAALLLILAGVGYERLYSLLGFGLAGLLAGLLAWRPVGGAGRLVTATVIHLLPFAVVNGIVTALPVVWFDNREILGFRIGAIPMEDLAYSFIVLTGTAALFARFRKS